METQITESNQVEANQDVSSSEGKVYTPSLTSQTNSSPNEISNKKEEQSSVSSAYLEPEKEIAHTTAKQSEVKIDNTKKKYHNIPNDTRMKLIDAVENKGEKIKHAAKRLSVNYSSAKSICQVFKREGRMKKKLIKQRFNRDESTSMYPETGSRYVPFNQAENDLTINHHIFKNEVDQPNDSTDRLMKMKKKLSEGRNGTNEERVDFYPYKKLHQSNYEQTANPTSEAQQLQQIERVIAQNNRLTAKSDPTQTINLQNSISKITISSTSANYNGNGANVNMSTPTQFISIAPSSTVYQPQLFQPTSNTVDGGQVRGYILANPQNPNTRQQIPGQQPMFVSSNNGGQMQLVFNQTQNHPQQQGFVNFVTHYQQPNNGEMMVMMNVSGQPNKQVSYVTPSNGTVSQHQQQYPMMVQAPQFMNMMPSSQQMGGFTQVQPQQMNGFSSVQPQQIGGFTTMQPQQISGYTQIQPQIGGFPMMQQQPMVCMLPSGNFVTQNISSSQGFGYSADPKAQINIKVSNTTQHQTEQNSNVFTSFQQTGTMAGAQMNKNSEPGKDNFVNFTMSSPQIAGFLQGIMEKKEFNGPTGITTKKVILEDAQKLRPASDLLNELKATNSSNIIDKRVGLKVLTQREKPE